MKLLLCLLMSAVFFVSCQNDELGNADGHVFVVTQGIEMVAEINEKFAIGQGEIYLHGQSLPFDFRIVSKGLIYGTDSSFLKIKSYSYNSSNYNSYYDCFQPYTYSTISSTANVVNIKITDTIWKDNNQIYGYEYWQAAGYGEFSCPLSNLQGGTRYYYRAFAHVSNYNTFDRYLYGTVKEFISGGITEDPTVYIAVDVLKIGIMKKDVGITKFGSEAYRLCSYINFDRSVGGYNDWRLPTLEELEEIYKLRNRIGGFKSDIYWSNKVYSDDIFYYYWNFATNTSGYASSENNPDGYVRLVRPLQ